MVEVRGLSSEAKDVAALKPVAIVHPTHRSTGPSLFLFFQKKGSRA